ncbi:MAG: LemA family protein [Nanoarchaeota archaeon]
MKKSTMIILGIVGAIVLILLIFGGWIGGTYNSLITQEEAVNNAWAHVEAQYQARIDKITNIVATVQGAADFESETQTQIAALRTQAVAAKQEWENAESIAERRAAARKISDVNSGLSGININVENYPNLRAVENFISLQATIEGAENRISVARQRYNDAVRAYNIRVRRFPSNIIANLFGFNQKEFFEADEGAAEAPDVSFN